MCDINGLVDKRKAWTSNNLIATMLLSLHENISKKIPKVQAEGKREKEKRIGDIH